MAKEEALKILDIRPEFGCLLGKHDIDTWMTIDPEAFQVAVTDEGEIVGACAAIIHREDLALIALYCVKEKYRGLGIGSKLWSTCMDRIGDRNACLNTLFHNTERYITRGGFPVIESWVGVHSKSTEANIDNLSDTPPKGIDVVSFTDCHLPLLYDYDEKVVFYDRKLALQLNCKEEDSKTFLAVKDGACVGFGTIKLTFQEQGRIGPLYADNIETAEVILKKLILSLPYAKGLAIFTINKPAEELVKKLGCSRFNLSQRLYRKKVIAVELSKVFAVGGFLSPY